MNTIHSQINGVFYWLGYVSGSLKICQSFIFLWFLPWQESTTKVLTGKVCPSLQVGCKQKKSSDLSSFRSTCCIMNTFEMKPIIASETEMITSPDCSKHYKAHRTITCNWYKLNPLNCLEPELRKWRTRPKTYKMLMFSWIGCWIYIVCFSFNSKTY